MAEFVTGYTVQGVADTHLRFRAVLALIDRVELAFKGMRVSPVAATRVEVLRAYEVFNRDLEEAAKLGAGEAIAQMRAAFDRSRRRPDSGVTPHLRTALNARPIRRFGTLATGEVGVADIGRLNKVTNPWDPTGTPYWQAQEYGNPAMQGRIIRGYFYGPGGPPNNPLRPLAARPSPLQPIFIASSVVPGPMGGWGGKGEIRNVPPARHFIKDGAQAARVAWLAAIDKAQADTISALAAVTP